LQSIRLTVTDGIIEIEENSKLFSQCCIAYRLEAGIPLCANSIESVHGHLNENIPRHNNYFHGCATLIQRINNRFKIMRKYLESKLVQNYKKIDKEVKAISEELMIELRKKYKTSNANCSCGSIYRLSCFYSAQIPCIHQRSINVPFPRVAIVKLPEFDVLLKTTFDFSDSVRLETTRNTKDDISEAPFRENEKEKVYNQCTDLTQIFENIVTMIMNVTKSRSRERIAKAIYKTFYNPEIYEDLIEPITNRIARWGISHRCLMVAEREIEKWKILKISYALKGK
jgi:hypothetical protein